MARTGVCRVRVNDRGAVRPRLALGTARQGPVGTGTHYPDHVPNPGHALVALLAAIFERNRTGLGRAIELPSSSRPSTSSGRRSWPMARPVRSGRETGTELPTQARTPSSRCGQRPLVCRRRSRRPECATCETLGHGEWADDPRFCDTRRPEGPRGRAGGGGRSATASCEPVALVTALQAAASRRRGPQCRPVGDEQLAARGFWRRLDHPVMGSIVANRGALPVQPRRSGPAAAAPLLGEHTREIAATVLGIDGPRDRRPLGRRVFN